jgi:hypothetical protein
MSGGSYNYLYSKDSEDIINQIPDMIRMRDRLIELDMKTGAVMLQKLILSVEKYRIEADARMDEMYPLMRAVEWMDSGDSGLDSVQEAYEKFLSK